MTEHYLRDVVSKHSHTTSDGEDVRMYAEYDEDGNLLNILCNDDCDIDKVTIRTFPEE